MTSKRDRGVPSIDGYYPTAWSQWEWNSEHSSWVRYRLTEPGQYEYGYDAGDAKVNEPARKLTQTYKRQPSPRSDKLMDQYTVDVEATLRASTSTNEEISVYDLGKATMVSLALPSSHMSENSLSHGNSEYPTGHLDSGFCVSSTPPSDENRASSFAMNEFEDTIIVLETKNTKLSFDEMHPSYCVYPPARFRIGKVFKVLPEGLRKNPWQGNDCELESHRTSHGENLMLNVRVFVVVQEKQGSSICLPLTTYNGRGLNKPGICVDNHATVYQKRPQCLKDEQISRMDPIRYVPDKTSRINNTDPAQDLDQTMRINYGEQFEVMHSVKVYFVGFIHKDSMSRLRESHRLVKSRMIPKAAGVEHSSAVATGSQNHSKRSESWRLSTPRNGARYKQVQDSEGKMVRQYGI